MATYSLDEVSSVKPQKGRYKLEDFVDESSGSSGSIANALGSGAFLGFDDELAGLTGSAFATITGNLPAGQSPIDAYKGIRDEARRHKKEYSARNPKKALAAEIGGGFLTGGASGLGVANQLQNVPKYLRYAVGGAVPGTIAAGGYSEHSPFEPVFYRDLGIGTTFGGAMGAGVPAVVQLAKGITYPLWSPVQAWMKKQASLAMRKVQEKMVDDGLTPDRLRARLSKLGDKATIADAGGENIKGLMRGAQAVPGKAKNQAKRFLDARQAGEGNRVMTQLKRVLSNQDDFHGLKDEINVRMKTLSKGAYDEAYKFRITPDEELINILNRPSVKSAARLALKHAADDDGRTLPMLEKIVMKGDDYSFSKEALPDMEALDHMKRTLDRMVSSAYRNGDPGANAMKNARNALKSKLDKMNPFYRKARKVYAGEASMDNALDAGRKLFREDSEITLKSIRSMSDGEKEMFRVGAARAIRDLIDATPDGADVYKRIFNKPGLRAKIEAVFPDKKSYRQFESFMLGERQKYITRGHVLGNSATARIEAEKLDSMIDPSPLVEAAKGNTWNFIDSLLRNASGRVNMPTERLRSNVTNILLNPDNATNQQTLKLLQESYIPQELLTNLQKSGVFMGSGMGGLLGGASAR